MENQDFEMPLSFEEILKKKLNEYIARENPGLATELQQMSENENS